MELTFENLFLWRISTSHCREGQLQGQIYSSSKVSSPLNLLYNTTMELIFEKLCQPLSKASVARANSFFSCVLLPPDKMPGVQSALCHSLQHTATHCNTLQHAATRCSTLHCNKATHCNTHCNTLQHTVATHCNTFDNV